VPASGLPLTRRPLAGRGRLPHCAVAIALALSAGGCSSPAVDKAAGHGAGAGIAVTTSADGLTIENHTTRPLLNVRVAVSAAGADTPFVRVVPTIDTDQNADVRFSELLSEAGTLLDGAVNTPQSATVAGRDTLGNTYSANARW
jgi:hypothetical protein